MKFTIISGILILKELTLASQLKEIYFSKAFVLAHTYTKAHNMNINDSTNLYYHKVPIRHNYNIRKYKNHCL